MLTRSPRLLIMILAATAVVPRAGAYSFISSPPTVWPNGNVPLVLKLGAAGRTLSDGNTSWDAVAQEAVDSWNAYLGTIQLTPTVQTAGPGTDNDHVSQIFFSSTIFGQAFGDYTLAVTTTWRTGTTRKEADVLFNTAWNWDSYRGPLRYSSDDFLRVAIHELGHALGLDHPDEYGQNVDAIMNSVVSSRDRLAADDISGARALYPSPPPVITAQPQSQIVAAGATVTFTVYVSGPEPITYQWRHNAVAIPGATNASVTISNAQTNDAGNYTVVINNTGGTMTSAAATLTIADPPTIARQPMNRVVVAGTSVEFSVLVAGTAPFRYQWFFNGAPIPGATTAIYAIDSVSAMNAGAYSVVVTNISGSAQSIGANLTVESGPIVVGPNLIENGSFESPTLLPGNTTNIDVNALLPWQTTGDSFKINATIPATSVDGAQALEVPSHAGTATVFQTIATEAGREYRLSFYQSPHPSAIGTLTVNIDSQVIATIQENGASLTEFQWTRFETNFIAHSNFTTIAFTGVSADASGTHIDDVWVHPTTPFITTQPVGRSVLASNSVVFSVAAAGIGPLTYQWFRNGTAIAGATNATFAMNSAQTNDTGTYTVRVSNSRGSVESAPAPLVVGLPVHITAQPQLQFAPEGGSATFHVAAEGTSPLNYQWSKDGAALAGATNSNLILSNLQLADVGYYSVLVGNAFGTQTSALAYLSIYPPPTIYTQPQNKAAIEGGSVVFAVAASEDAPLTYQWFFNGLPIPGATNSAYYVNGVRRSDAGSYNVRVQNAAGAVESTAATLTVRFPPVIDVQPIGQRVSTGGSATLSVSVTAVPPPSYQWYFNGIEIPGATASSYSITSARVNQSGNYTVMVGNSLGSVSSAAAAVQVADMPPSVALSPTNQVVLVGSNVVVHAAMTGTAPFYCQWLLKGRKIAGQTNADLLVPNIQLPARGNYQVDVGNKVGVVRSGTAQITVVAPPVIVSPARAMSLKSGRRLTLSAAAKGSKPFTYQWYKDGVAIAGATNRAFKVLSVQPGDAGLYSVRVSNIGTSTEAVQATVTVLP